MRRALLLLMVLLVAGCTNDAAPPVARPTSLTEPTATTPAATSADPTSSTPATPTNTVHTAFTRIQLEPFLSGFDSPLLLTHAGIPDEVYVVEQGGRIWRVSAGTRSVWLDLTADTRHQGERGLLGLAFAPDGRAYVSHTDPTGDSVLERVHKDMRRERLLLVDQPYANHNGGHLAFGPDGLLYYGLGDGGSAGDPQGNGQDPDALLGSLLRLNVSGETGYTIPPDNFRKEVWAKGLRNPWRFSFDRLTGDLYIGDVGQNKIEEIDRLPAGAPAGANFGWNAYEGSERYSITARPFSDVLFPIAEYPHQFGCSVAGGYVHRGEREPALQGTYYLGDYCSGRIWGLKPDAAGWKLVELLDTDHRISSFGEDARGDVYVVDHGGAILRIAAKTE